MATVCIASALCTYVTDVFSLPRRAGFVESMLGAPDPDTFSAANYDAGFGVPLVMRGAAAGMPAIASWMTDHSLNMGWGGEQVGPIEWGKKETRLTESTYSTLAEFLAMYNTSDVYLVAGLPHMQKRLGKQLLLPRFLECAQLVRTLDRWLLWMSSGGSKSVIHRDASDNVLCQLHGTKRLALWNASQYPIMESDECGWYNADVGNAGGYGEWARVDVEAIDIGQFHGFAKMPWWEAKLESGDCLFLPSGWYHHVHSLPGRNLAVGVWWHRQLGAREPCVHRRHPGKKKKSSRVRLDECSWLEGERPTNTHLATCRGFDQSQAEVKLEL